MAVVKVGQDEIDLDETLLEFNEATISEYLQKEAALYNYYYECLNNATYYLSTFEDRYEAAYNSNFVLAKEEGKSDKMAEAKAASDPEVLEAQKKVRLCKKNKDMIYSFLRSFDKAHENALNFCYNLRKELDKIYGSIKTPDHMQNQQKISQEEELKNIFKKN